MKKNIHGHKYNWRPSTPDLRDQYVKFRKSKKTAIPPVIDLRPQMPPVYDQGQLSSCSSQAIAGAYEFEMMKQKEKPFVPSRLFIYYNERAIENDVPDDNGAIIRDGLKTVVKQGVCPEDMWSYIPAKFAERPPQQCYDEAMKHRVVKYQRLTQDLMQFQMCLAAGYPIIFGFSVYSAFESKEMARTGVLNMPQPGEKDEGGHAVLCAGMNIPERHFIIRNSWGPNFAMGGYFFMPFDYMTSPDLASDFWTIQLVE